MLGCLSGCPFVCLCLSFWVSVCLCLLVCVSVCLTVCWSVWGLGLSRDGSECRCGSGFAVLSATHNYRVLAWSAAQDRLRLCDVDHTQRKQDMHRPRSGRGYCHRSSLFSSPFPPMVSWRRIGCRYAILLAFLWMTWPCSLVLDETLCRNRPLRRSLFFYRRLIAALGCLSFSQFGAQLVHRNFCPVDEGHAFPRGAVRLDRSVPFTPSVHEVLRQPRWGSASAFETIGFGGGQHPNDITCVLA